MVISLLILSSVSSVINNNTAIAFPPKNPSVASNMKKNFIVAINPGASDSSSQNPFNASKITMPVGSNVTWINNDNFVHTIVSGTPDKGPSNIFYSSPILPGKEFTFQMAKPGVYPYYDRSYMHMKGQIIVQPLNNTR